MAIILENICKSFDNKVVIDHFNYEFMEGKMYAIIGESGSGKSTLLNIIGFLDKPDFGVVSVYNYNNISPKSYKATLIRREYISYLFQNYALCTNESIEYNLKIALQYVKNTNKKKEMLEALKKVNVQASLSTKIYQLSGGEQQRVALARLLLKPSRIILADEPTGNLDKQNADVVIDILKTLKNQNKIVILVTHDMEIAKKCEEIINLSKHNITQ